MTGTMRKIQILTAFLAYAVSAVPAYGQAVLKDRLEKHVYTLADDSMAGRKAGSVYAAEAAGYIASEFEKAGVQPYFNGTYFQVFYPDMLIGKSKNACKNVVGIIPGNDHEFRDEYIVVGAHYDHIGTDGSKGDIYNGADDNASGVAALIELGRQLSDNRALLRRSVILVAFDAEESGLHGSRYFLNNVNIPEKRIKLMFSIDMVGWYQASQTLYYYGAGTLKDSKSAFSLSAAQVIGLNVVTEKFERKISVATDTEYFALKGVPTFHVTTGDKSPYHKPDDRPEIIDYDGLAKVTAHLTVMVSYFAQDGTALPSGKKAFKHRDRGNNFEFGITAVAGSNFFNYTSGHERGKTAASYGGGVYGQMNFNYFGLRPEVRYERMGARNADGRLWMNSVVVPFSFVLQTPRHLVAGTYVSAGGYYRYMFSGRQKDNSAGLKDIYYRNEAGALWSVGVWVSRISVAVERRYGCTKLMRDAGTGPNYKNRTTYFTMSYTF